MNIWKNLTLLARHIRLNLVVYKVYERYLWNQIKDKRIPEHIGFILDGNRRWASLQDVPRLLGHRAGVDKVDALVDWCIEAGIKSITLYAFSTENFTRSPEEVAGLMSIFDEKLKAIATDERIHRNRVHVRVIGRLSLLPESTQRLAHAAEALTRDYDRHFLNIALAYGGRAEIVDAAKQIALKAKEGKIGVESIDEKMISEHMYTAHLPKQEPDLIIRTSGEERTSGFLLWQGAYSELSFSDVFWPEFRRIDLWRAIRTYQRRKRRYGT